MVETLTGMKITDKEWHKVRRHARFLGPLKPAIAYPTFRQRVSQNKLTAMLQYLENPGNLQRYAFGTKLLKMYGQTVEIDNVDRCKPALDLAVEFVMELDTEINGGAEDDELPPDEDRCSCVEPRSMRRCRSKAGHLLQSPKASRTLGLYTTLYITSYNLFIYISPILDCEPI